MNREKAVTRLPIIELMLTIGGTFFAVYPIILSRRDPMHV